MKTVLKGRHREAIIEADRPFVIIGEKINPTGSKKLAAALREDNLEFVRGLARKQVDWGADALDINVGVPGLDEVKVMARVVEAIRDVVDVPLCIDSGKIDILAAGLESSPGKPMVNSVTAEAPQLEAILPIVKERGAAVIGLTITDAGIPKSPAGRLEAATKIVERAAQLGIPQADVVIDPLVLTVGSDSSAALTTLHTIELIRRELGVNINLGASNVSFGLPDRLTLNQAFLAMAMHAGAACAISDPTKLGACARASDVLLGRDPFAARYLKYFRATELLDTQVGHQGNA
jgi:5-methyltetrahydrofolate--homocysteine methyltransferase